MITARVDVDGTRLADGSPGDDEDEPTVLAGLTITWGRATTVDQPSPSTLTFDLIDEAGGSTFGDRLATGSQVDVYATGGITWPADQSILYDYLATPGTPPGWTVHNASAVVVAGGGVAIVTPPARMAGPDVAVFIPPAPFSSDRAAWDRIPPTLPGSGPWTGRADIVRYGPDAAALDMPTWQGPTYPGAYHPTAWQALTSVEVAAEREWMLTEAGRWPGLAVTVHTPTWAEMPADLSWDQVPADLTWADLGAFELANLALFVPTDYPDERTVQVFSGRATDVSAMWDEAVQAPRVQVVAADILADLGNRDVGDEPWPAEPMATRFGRITAAAGIPVTVAIDPRPGAMRVSWMDVDRQAAADMLAELATSTDAILWAASHADTGAYLYVQDTNRALPLETLGLVGGVVVIVPAGPGAEITLDAELLLEAPVTWRQSVSDVITRAVVGWMDQTLNDQGLPDPTERTVQVVDDAAEAEVGARRLSVGTVLADEAGAEAIAAQLLARLHRAEWRVGGLEWPTEAQALTADELTGALDLLDGTRRLGAPVRLINLPDWTPGGASTGGFLEGGSYSFGAAGWDLSLIVSSSTARGQAITWQEVDPAFSWAEFDPAITWDDMRSVGPPSVSRMI